MSSSKDTPESTPRKGSAIVQVVNEGVGISESVHSSVAAAALRPLPQDHPFYAKIGRITAEWARLEHILDVTIWDLAGIDPNTGSAITGQMLGTYRRLSAVLALAALHGHSEATMAEIDNLRNKASGTAKLRNRFVHDAWYIQDANGEASAGQFKNLSADWRKKGTTKTPSGFSPIPDNSLDECLREIGERIDGATTLQRTLCRAPRA